jgi:hypothetical protein
MGYRLNVFTGQLDIVGSGGGVSSLNGLTGALTIAGSGGITVTPLGSTITIDGSGFANTALSNLASTAVNVDINPGADDTINLGTSGLAYANLFTYQIQDSSGVVAVDVGNRVLEDNTGTSAIIFSNLTRQILDSSAVLVLDYNARTLYDSANIIAMSFGTGGGTGNRKLFDNSGNVALNFKQRILVDGAGIDSLNWDSRVLEDTGAAVALNYSDPTKIVIPPNTGSSLPRAISFRNGGDTNGSLIQANNSIGSDTLFQLPPNNGSSLQFLQTDGTGVTSWASVIIPTNNKETFVLSNTNITNQYIDLAHVAKTNSIIFMVDGSGSLLEGASYAYSVNYTGGAGGNTRITFLNNIATGGGAALVAGDVVQVNYVF